MALSDRIDVRFDVSDRGMSGLVVLIVSFVEFDPMYGPAVRRKRVRRSGDSGLASMYPASDWCVVLRANMDISAPAISLADRPRWAIWVTSVHRRREDRTSISSRSLADLGMTGVAAPVINYATRSLLASKSLPRANTLQAMRASLLASAIARTVVMQPLLGRFEPGLEPMPLPALRLDQYDPRRLHEQDPQVAIAALGYLAQDRSVAGRHLPRNEPQPCGEVSAFGECIARTDRCHHRAGDDRPDARYTHQPLAAGLLACDGFDLAR